MAEELTSERALRRVRSPNYPAMSLVEAVQQIHKLFGKIGQHPAPRDAVATSMGYSGLHGASATAISALIKYGLLERVGEDYKLSELAMKIIAPHNQGEKAHALEVASQSPALFAELFGHFQGDVPGDGLLRSYLLRKGFAQAAVRSVIAAYRETMELVDRESGEYHSQPKAEVAPTTKPNDDLGKFVDTVFTGSPAAPPQGVKPMESERVVFTHEIEPSHSVRVVANGAVDSDVLDALEAFIALQKKKLGIAPSPKQQ
jgi:hypothetical protein